ncbi:MAG: hypothetical protein HYU97_04190 [Deltaproteobacteria bacterium]|nr:hypothetical protein [Deltaproteobacteria bacterium]
MLSTLITQLNHDCIEHGYRRKKWWADQLKIPPLTLSHWLAGRQLPSGEHALKISSLLNQNRTDKKTEKWVQYLWDCYYKHQPLLTKLLPDIILNVLSKSTLDSRILALLSYFVKKYSPNFEIPVDLNLKNRLGWLLESSEKKVTFKPIKSVPNQLVLNLPLSDTAKKFLRRYQTSIGKKWKIYDCPLAKLRASFL